MVNAMKDQATKALYASYRFYFYESAANGWAQNDMEYRFYKQFMVPLNLIN